MAVSAAEYISLALLGLLSLASTASASGCTGSYYPNICTGIYNRRDCRNNRACYYDNRSGCLPNRQDCSSITDKRVCEGLRGCSWKAPTPSPRPSPRPASPVRPYTQYCCGDCTPLANSIRDRKQSADFLLQCFIYCRKTCTPSPKPSPKPSPRPSPDTVDGNKCLELTAATIKGVGDAACDYAYEKCGQVRFTAQLQVSRPQCYRASKNACYTWGQDYQADYCLYNSSFSCLYDDFIKYYNQKLDEICEKVGKAIAITLP